MNTFDLKKKPSKNECPKEYCFEWVEAGGLIAKGLHDNIDQALTKLEEVKESCCTCSFGTCFRISHNPDHTDWYEACEPALEADGLPWFFFYSDPSEINEEQREKYIKQSEALWGKKHWLNNE